MENKIISIISYIFIMFVTILIGSFAISFLVKKSAVCDKEHIHLCAIKDTCTTNDLYWWDDSCHIIEERESKPEEFADYNYYQGMKKIKLVTSTSSWVTDEKEVEGRTYKKFVKSGGKILSGYLFVDVSVGNEKSLTVWDSIYVSLRRIINGYEYEPVLNGHLLRAKSLEVPESNTTRLLYDLRQISLTSIPYSDNNKFENKNWLDMLNNADIFNIEKNYDIKSGYTIAFELETFLSTLRGDGMINEITIGYECEEADQCSLKLEEIE